MGRVKACEGLISVNTTKPAFAAPYEFSRPLDVESLVEGEPWGGHLQANADECAALAKRFDALEVSNFKADLTVQRRVGGRIEIAGVWQADAVQSCVVTLEPIPVHLEGKIKESLVGVASIAELDESEVALDSPEPFEGNRIDLGEVLAQTLGVNLPPYPRKPGAVWQGESQDSPPVSLPLSDLARLLKE